MDLLEANCRDGIDVGYATQCFNEAQDDYFQMVYYGDVDEGRQRALEAQVWELEVHRQNTGGKPRQSCRTRCATSRRRGQ